MLGGSVVLTLDAPMQSWGGPAVGTEHRPTAAAPSLSGVCGLIANALGRDRGHGIDDLADARMHVRVDRPGVRVRDWHTVGTGAAGRHRDGVPAAVSLDDANRAAGKVLAAKSPVAGHRWYLCDAAFTVVWTPAAAGVDAAVAADALRRPARPLYLGRKSCPPAAPVLVGVTAETAETVFRELPLLRDRPPADPGGDHFADVAAADSGDDPTPAAAVVMVEIVNDADGPAIGGSGHLDVPATFDPARRWHGYHHRWTAVRRQPMSVDLCAGRSRAAHQQRREALAAINTAPAPQLR